jgi:hypothetical protein
VSRRPLAAALVAAAVVVGGCGGNKEHKSETTTAPKAPVAPSAPPAKRPPADIAPNGGLAIGLSEINPDLFWHGKDVGDFGPWRDRFEALKPPLYRLTVDWASLQPSPDGPVDWARRSDGCMRGLQPCRAYDGIQDTLRAIRSQQQAGNGFAVMVVFYGVPEWAARKPSGCERDDITARSRPITAQGLEAYKRMVRSLQDLARREGVAIRWWSPWNEPNGPFFISPQRRKCRGNSKTLAPAVYARLARAMREELQPGQDMVVGELAGLKNARKYGSSIAEFYAGLPDAVVCNAAVFAQHAYAQRGDSADDPGAVGALEQALDRRPCARDKPIWVTETGVGGPHVGDERSPNDASIRADCQALNVALRRWDKDPRVSAAFQYTFRDDPVFPVGLVDAKLTKKWPAYDLFKAWAGDRDADGPAPSLPDACRA